MQDDGDDKVRQAHAAHGQAGEGADAPAGQGEFGGLGIARGAHGQVGTESPTTDAHQRKTPKDDEEDTIHACNLGRIRHRLKPDPS